jgi:hypothetical protein
MPVLRRIERVNVFAVARIIRCEHFDEPAVAQIVRDMEAPQPGDPPPATAISRTKTNGTWRRVALPAYSSPATRLPRP